MKCRTCGSEDLRKFFTQGNKDQYQYYRCNNCQLVNLDLSSVDITANQEKYVDQFLQDIDYESQAGMIQACNFITKYVPVKGKYLDIGCGDGSLLYLLKKNGWEVKGLELSPVVAERVKTQLNIEVDVANFLEMKNQSETYDLVSLRHVLEHLPDSILAMNKIRGLLKKDGYAHFEFPNIDSVTKKRKRFSHKLGFRKKYDPTYVPGHCNEFSRPAFEYLIKRTGFRLIRWETYSSKPMANRLYNLVHVGSKARTIVQKVD